MAALGRAAPFSPIPSFLSCPPTQQGASCIRLAQFSCMFKPQSHCFHPTAPRSKLPSSGNFFSIGCVRQQQGFPCGKKTTELGYIALEVSTGCLDGGFSVLSI